ncbi:MAG: hypothetical protein NVS4B11_16500 [Ktedonobacteraceae bacterium]
MSKQLRLDVAQLTDVGRKRPHNEDNMAYVIPKDPQVMTKKGALFIVADGMGGHAAGEVASEIAVDTVSYAYYQEDNEDIAVSLVHAIKRANTLIHQRAAENMLRSGMGTTCVAGVLRGGTAYIANVGDSRTYLVRNGQVKQISQDHSWVAEQVRAGLLTEDQARSHAQRNVITRCLGTQADVEVDVFAEPLEEGDSFILCSDGLSGFVNDDDLRAIINQYIPQESVYHLVERANENGGPDNITAIVVRIQEVGWEPPAIHRNGHVNGRDITNETTLTDAQMTDVTVQGENGRIPSALLRMPTGPLHPSESITAPQPALQASSRRRGRLLYPTLILLILFIVTLVGSGIYYFVHMNSSAAFDSSLQKAQTLIAQGHDVASKNPTQALQYLSNAQAILLALQTTSLTDAQRTQVTVLQERSFTTTVKSAVLDYNTQSSITVLPCASTLHTSISNGSTNTFATSIATIQNEKSTKTFSYVLGEDHKLYLLNESRSLQPSYSPSTPTQILTLASDHARLLAVTGTVTTGGVLAAPYGLLLLTADDTGALTARTQSTPIPTTDGNVPSLLSAWSTDVYVVLTSSTAPTSATIVDYPIEKNNTLSPLSGKNSKTISVSNAVVSMAAFPSHQLFLLTKDGNVQSFTFTGANQAVIPVEVQPALASPVPFDARTFGPSTPVVVPSQTLQQSTVLQVPSAKFLVAEAVGNDLHLYIVDDTTYHRILDLKMMPNATTPATAGSLMNMHLIQQYLSSTLLVNVKGMVEDPKSARLYLIAQTEPSTSARTLITIDTTPNAPCTS